MKQDKEGKVIFETEAEFHNYWDAEMSEAKIREDIEKRGFNINVKDKITVYRAYKRAVSMLDDSKHREGKALFNIVLDAMHNHGIKRDVALDWISREWKLPIERVKDIERRTAEAIMRYLDLMRIPLTMGEMAK